MSTVGVVRFVIQNHYRLFFPAVVLQFLFGSLNEELAPILGVEEKTLEELHKLSGKALMYVAIFIAFIGALKFLWKVPRAEYRPAFFESSIQMHGFGLLLAFIAQYFNTVLNKETAAFLHVESNTLYGLHGYIGFFILADATFLLTVRLVDKRVSAAAPKKDK